MVDWVEGGAPEAEVLGVLRSSVEPAVVEMVNLFEASVTILMWPELAGM